MSVDEIIQASCKELKLAYVFATVANGKVILSSYRRFPALIRTFGESITETQSADEFTSEMMFYFAENMVSDSDIDKMQASTRRMQYLGFEFIRLLRKNGIRVETSNVRTSLGEFDNCKLSGLAMTAKLTYTVCDGCK